MKKFYSRNIKLDDNANYISRAAFLTVARGINNNAISDLLRRSDFRLSAGKY